jgi:hypothetical protein
VFLDWCVPTLCVWLIFDYLRDVRFGTMEVIWVNFNVCFIFVFDLVDLVCSGLVLFRVSSIGVNCSTKDG